MSVTKAGPLDRSYGETACAPLVKPIRARILEVVNVRPISPIEFVNQELWPAGYEFSSAQHALSHASYHFRALEKAGCIEVIRERKVRGAVEHTYTASSSFTTEEFDRLPKQRRRKLSRLALRSFIARADSAIWADTFDSRTDRHLTWVPMEVDQRGWDEIGEALDTCFEAVQRIRDEAGARLEEEAEPAIPATVALFGFESPPSPLPPSEAATAGCAALAPRPPARRAPTPSA